MQPHAFHIRLRNRRGLVVATAPRLPGCRGVGPDEATAIRHLERAINAYLRPPPSPFATVRKRLSERAAGI